MFRSLTRPFAELKRTCVPSKSTHTGVTCGLPSFISVPRFPKACFSSRSAWVCGITSLIFPSLSLRLNSTQMNFRNKALGNQSRSRQLLHFFGCPAGRNFAKHQTLGLHVHHCEIRDNRVHAF